MNLAKRMIKFVRQRDFEFVEELGRGACGMTVLLRDPIIDEFLVCKKYEPLVDPEHLELFTKFVQEIKILHKLFHTNVVRVFNYYLFPDDRLGYIMMEHVDGSCFNEYLSSNPESLNEVFEQVVDGFCYLEKNSVLHRDVRSENIMITNDGVVKIIDFGFGKITKNSMDYDKSISLNWWCGTPYDFSEDIYDHATEVYFVGKLFEHAIRDLNIGSFKYSSILRQMVKKDRNGRLGSFVEISKNILAEEFEGIEFSNDERSSYQEFAQELSASLAKLSHGAKYINDYDKVLVMLEGVYKQCMLEDIIPHPVLVLRCLVSGAYKYYDNRLYVRSLRDFISLLKSVSIEKKSIIFANLHTRLDAIERYEPGVIGLDDVPF